MDDAIEILQLHNNEKETVLDLVYCNFKTEELNGLSIEQLQSLYSNLRDGWLSQQQIEAAASYVCACPALCDREELLDVLKEMDRRYYLSRDLRWEFAMLDRQRKSAISKSDAAFLFRMVHGEFFSAYRFDAFIANRLVPSSDITFDEIEVDLCNIPTQDWLDDIMLETKNDNIAMVDENDNEEEIQKKAAEELRKQEEEAEREIKERLRAMELKKQEDAKAEAEQKAEEEKKRLEEEKVEKERQEEEERLREEERLKRIEEEKEKARLEEIKQKELKEQAKSIQESAETAAKAEEEAEKQLEEVQKKLKETKNEEEKKQAKEEKLKAEQALLKNKEDRLRSSLHAAVKVRKRPKIDAVVVEAKEAKIVALKPDIKIAEETSDSIKCGEELENAMVNRHLSDIETGVEKIKTKGFEEDHKELLTDAEKLAEKLRKLEKLKKDILALDQRTISEIRSYKTPIPAIHEVMIAVYIILGYKEKELKAWKYIQALLGRSGKEGLKRMVTSLEASKVNMDHVQLAEKKYLAKHTLESITDVSAGAGTFYVWSTAMIDEARSWNEDGEFRKRIEEKRKQEAEEEKRLKEEQKKRKAKKQPEAGRSRASKAPATKRTTPSPGRTKKK